MHKSLPELTGNTRVYLDDDSPTNSVAGVLYPNPPGTKMHSVNETYTCRGVNRIIGNVAANVDTLFVNQLREVAEPERVVLPTGVQDFTIPFRFAAQGVNLVEMTKFVHQVTNEEYFSAFDDKIEVIEIRYTDAALGDIRVDNLPPSTDITIVNSSTLITAMLRHGLRVTAVLTAASIGDVCILSGGANDGRYLIIGIDSGDISLANIDGSPVQLGPLSLTGFDVTSPPATFKVVGNGRFLTNAKVVLPEKVPSGGPYEVIVGKATRRPYSDLFGSSSVIRAAESIPEKVMEVIMQMKGLTGPSPQWIDPVPAPLNILSEIGLDLAYDTTNLANPPGFGRDITVDAGAVELNRGADDWGDTRDSGFVMEYLNGAITSRPTFINMATNTLFGSFMAGNRLLVPGPAGSSISCTLSGSSAVLSGSPDLSRVPTTAAPVPALLYIVKAIDDSDNGLYYVGAVDDGTDTVTVANLDFSPASFVGPTAEAFILFPQVSFGASTYNNVAAGMLSDAYPYVYESSIDPHPKSILSLLTLNGAPGLKIHTNDHQDPPYLITRGEPSSRADFAVINSRSDSSDYSLDHWVSALEVRTPLHDGVNILFSERADGNGNDVVTLTRTAVPVVPGFDSVLDGRQWAEVYARVTKLGSNSALYNDNDGVYRVVEVFPGTKNVRLAELNSAAPAPIFTALSGLGTIEFFSRDVVLRNKEDASGRIPALMHLHTKRGSLDNTAIDITADHCQGRGSAIRVRSDGLASVAGSLIDVVADADGSAGPYHAIYGSITPTATAGFMRVVHYGETQYAHGISLEMYGDDTTDTNAGVRVVLESGARLRAGVLVEQLNASQCEAGVLIDVELGAAGVGLRIDNTDGADSAVINHNTDGHALRVNHDSYNVIDVDLDSAGHEIDLGSPDVAEPDTRMLWPAAKVLGVGRSTAGFLFGAGESITKNRSFPFSSGIRSFVKRNVPVLLDGWQQRGGAAMRCVVGATPSPYTPPVNPTYEIYLGLTSLPNVVNPGDAAGYYDGWTIVLNNAFSADRRLVTKYVAAPYGGLLTISDFWVAPAAAMPYVLYSPIEPSWSRSNSGHPANLLDPDARLDYLETWSDRPGDLLLSIEALPGSLLQGATIRLAGDNDGSPLQFEVNFHREAPALAALAFSSPLLGDTPNQNHISEIPRATGTTVIIPGVDSMVTVPLVQMSGIPCWIANLGTASFVAGPSGAYYTYQVTFAGKGSEDERIFEHTHPAFTAGGFTPLDISFLGDYLWLINGSNAGLYPILEAVDVAGNLRLTIGSKDPLAVAPGVPSTQCGIPAIVNPGSKVFLSIDAGHNEVSRVYPGIAYTLAYNDTYGEGFPVATLDSFPFPALP